MYILIRFIYFFRFNVYLLISFQCLLIPFNNIVVSLTPFRHLYTKRNEIHFSFYYDFSFTINSILDMQNLTFECFVNMQIHFDKRQIWSCCTAANNFTCYKFEILEITLFNFNIFSLRFWHSNWKLRVFETFNTIFFIH